MKISQKISLKKIPEMKYKIKPAAVDIICSAF